MLYPFGESPPASFSTATSFNIIYPPISSAKSTPTIEISWSHWLSTLFKKKTPKQTFEQKIANCDFIYWNGIQYLVNPPIVTIYHAPHHLNDVILFMKTLSCEQV